jgi:hypothetical protein
MVKAMAVAMDGRHPSGRARAGQGYNYKRDVQRRFNDKLKELSENSHEVEGDEHKVDGEVTNKPQGYFMRRFREGVDEELEEQRERSKQKNMGKTRRAQKTEVTSPLPDGCSRSATVLSHAHAECA